MFCWEIYLLISSSYLNYWSQWLYHTTPGATINNDKMKSVSGSLVLDDNKEYAVTSEVKVDQTKTRTQLSPMFELRRVGAKNIQLSGSISVLNPVKSVDVDLSLSGLSQMPYTLKGKWK